MNSINTFPQRSFLLHLGSAGVRENNNQSPAHRVLIEQEDFFFLISRAKQHFETSEAKSTCQVTLEDCVGENKHTNMNIRTITRTFCEEYELNVPHDKCLVFWESHVPDRTHSTTPLTGCLYY